MELTYSLEEIHEVAKQILNAYPHNRCFAFYAEMGSGKTTLIKALCHHLGVIDLVSIPTFSIINEYRINDSDIKVFHMDWYRLKNEQDAIEAGVQDILEQTSIYCFIEWPEMASSILPKHTLSILIKPTSSTQRLLEINN